MEEQIRLLEEFRAVCNPNGYSYAMIPITIYNLRNGISTQKTLSEIRKQIAEHPQMGPRFEELFSEVFDYGFVNIDISNDIKQQALKEMRVPPTINLPNGDSIWTHNGSLWCQITIDGKLYPSKIKANGTQVFHFINHVVKKIPIEDKFMITVRGKMLQGFRAMPHFFVGNVIDISRGEEWRTTKYDIGDGYFIIL